MTPPWSPLDDPTKRIWVWGLGHWALMGLTGCASPRPAPTHPAAFWSGRMGLHVDGTPPQNWNTSFELQGSPEQGELVLLSPIGTTLARLRWTPQSAVLEQGQGPIESANLTRLSHRLTGTALPIAALFDWLAGRATEEPGWQVDLSAHAQGRLIARRHAPAPPAVLRIVLER